MKIELSQIRQIVNGVFDSITEHGISSIDIDYDFYWSVAVDDISRVSLEPSQVSLNIGSLVDELGFVLKNLEAEAQPVAYQLTEIAPILRYIGEKLGKEIYKDKDAP